MLCTLRETALSAAPYSVPDARESARCTEGAPTMRDCRATRAPTKSLAAMPAAAARERAETGRDDERATVAVPTGRPHEERATDAPTNGVDPAPRIGGAALMSSGDDRAERRAPLNPGGRAADRAIDALAPKVGTRGVIARIDWYQPLAGAAASGASSAPEASHGGAWVTKASPNDPYAGIDDRNAPRVASREISAPR